MRCLSTAVTNTANTTVNQHLYRIFYELSQTWNFFWFGRSTRGTVHMMLNSQICTAGSESRSPFIEAPPQLRVRPPGHQAGQYPPPPQAARLDPHRLWLLRPDWYAAAATGSTAACVTLASLLDHVLVPYAVDHRRSHICSLPVAWPCLHPIVIFVRLGSNAGVKEVHFTVSDKLRIRSSNAGCVSVCP